MPRHWRRSFWIRKVTSERSAAIASSPGAFEASSRRSRSCSSTRPAWSAIWKGGHERAQGREASDKEGRRAGQ